jgi:hypothetical protein
VVGRFETFAASHGPFTGKVGVLRRLRPDAAAVRVLGTAGFVEAIHIFAIHHHLTVSSHGRHMENAVLVLIYL